MKVKISTKDAAKINQALALHQVGRFDEALSIYKKLLRSIPANPKLLTAIGTLNLQIGNIGEGVRVLSQSIAIQPSQFDALNNLAAGLMQLGRPEEALKIYEQIISIHPESPEAHNNRGIALFDTGRYDEALNSYINALAIRPDFTEAYYNQGNSLQQLGQFESALSSYSQAITIRPGYAEAHYAKGNVLTRLNRLDEALVCYREAINVSRYFAEAHYNYGVALQKLDRLEEALSSYRAAVTIKQDYAEAHNNCGSVLKRLDRLDESLNSYDRAIEINPNYVEAHYNRGSALLCQGLYVDAINSFDKAFELNPNANHLFGSRLHAKMQICDWSEFDESLAYIKKSLDHGMNVAEPIVVAALCGDPIVQLNASRLFSQEKFPESEEGRTVECGWRHEKIKVGYFSSDYHNHATSYLIAGMLEHHDRDRFELVGFSFGPEIDDEMSRRVSSAFDRFVVVSGVADPDVARLSRELEIDIAVDLKGYTEGSRTAIFSHHAAPIQVNYLGYPGTMGCPYIDYVIADNILIPAYCQQHYSESIAYLPHSYQANDANRSISSRVFTREELGLPQDAFVYCCFNNNFKILPNTFDVWMRLLSKVEGSVLWLLEDNAYAAKNLRAEAARRSIDPDRLIFAKRIPVAEHLARHRAADLFLDTLPYNAHTTASDALWAGLPVLTCIGEAFASRVAASLVSALGAPELIANTQSEYEDLAIQLATTPSMLKSIRKKISENRLNSPLFDTRNFTRHIEATYLEMVGKYRSGIQPEHIYVLE